MCDVCCVLCAHAADFYDIIETELPRLSKIELYVTACIIIVCE